MAYVQRRGQPKRRDVKDRTMNRFAALDDDITSRYDDYDDDERNLPINQRVTVRTMRGGSLALMRNRPQRQPTAFKRDPVWQVTVRCGSRSSSQFVAQVLSENVENFLPFNMEVDGQKNVTFYVLTEDEAENLRLLNRRIALPETNEKLNLFTRRTSAPWESLAPNIKKAIKDVLVLRYNQSSNSLDLGQFQHDKIFVDGDLGNLASLSRNAVMVEVIRLVAENYSKLKTVECLDKLRNWAVERLHLENNPLCADFADASSYTSAVHDYFPRVSYLDGAVVHCNPFKVNADLQRRAGVPYPQVQPGYCPDDELKQRVEQLLLQFFDIYDGEQPAKSRQQLINAYDEDAIFSHCIQIVPDIRPVQKGDEDAFRQYIRSSHNLLHEEKWQNYREKIVYRGAMEVAVALSRLPRTQHIKESFVLDFVHVDSSLLVFTCRGLVRDGQDVTAPLDNCCFKFFNRSMAVVPKADGKMAIVNDQLTLTPVNPERMDRYNKMMKKAMEAPVDPQPNQPSATGLGGLDMSSMQLAPSTSSAAAAAQMPGPSGLQDQLRLQQQQQQQQQQLQMQAGTSTFGAVQQVQQQQTTEQAPPPTPTPSYDRSDPQMQAMMVTAFSQQSGMKPEWSRKCLEDLQWDYEAAGNAFNQFRASIPPEAFQ